MKAKTTLLKKAVKTEKKLTYEEWEEERLRRIKKEEEADAKKRHTAGSRFWKLLAKQPYTQALEKDDKTLLHEHWDEKYG